MGTPCGVRPTTGREGKLKQKGQYQFFVTATILKRWLKLLLDNVIISFGQDIILRQEIGLPMGINPAVFIANYYGLDYEVDFFQQLIRQNRYDILAQFRFYSRFVDDILTLLNEMFHQYLYRNQIDEHGTHGIFPACLIINTEADTYDTIDYMDLSIFHDEEARILQSTIYDKKEHPPLDKIKSVQYPQPSSFLHASTMYNVLNGQLHRNL